MPSIPQSSELNQTVKRQFVSNGNSSPSSHVGIIAGLVALFIVSVIIAVYLRLLRLRRRRLRRAILAQQRIINLPYDPNQPTSGATRTRFTTANPGSRTQGPPTASLSPSRTFQDFELPNRGNRSMGSSTNRRDDTTHPPPVYDPMHLPGYSSKAAKRDPQTT